MGRTDGAGVGLKLQALNKCYDDIVAVDHVDLEAAPGEFLTLLGPSGSGKTTTLNMIAGFIKPTSGRILLGDREIEHMPPHKRNIGMVFQSYALFPHMSCFDNVAFPLRQRRYSRQEVAKLVNDALEMVGLADRARYRPGQLSGGQQQRIALARALVFRPSLLLMDEPLGALDKKLREHLQLEIMRIHRELGITFVYVTHDQEEALVMSDRIAIFNEGRIEQVGTAEEVYDRPATMFTSQFLGESNRIPLTISGLQDQNVLAARNGDNQTTAQTGSLDAHRPVYVVVRPERLRVTVPPDLGTPRSNQLKGRVRQVVYLGSARRLEIDLDVGGCVVVREQSGSWSPAGAGDPVAVGWDPADAVLLPEQAPAGAAAGSQEQSTG